MLAVTDGLLDAVKLSDINNVEGSICAEVPASLPDVGERMIDGQKLTDSDRKQIHDHVRNTLDDVQNVAADVEAVATTPKAVLNADA